MGVTSRGYPYPDGVEPVNVPYDLQQLAEAVDADLADSGWVNVAITDARITVYGAGLEPKYRIKNGYVTVTGVITTTTAGLIDSGLAFATLPAAARPASTVNSVQQASGDDRWSLSVSAAGAIAAERYGPGAQGAGVWLPFHVVYPLG